MSDEKSASITPTQPDTEEDDKAAAKKPVAAKKPATEEDDTAAAKTPAAPKKPSAGKKDAKDKKNAAKKPAAAVVPEKKAKAAAKAKHARTGVSAKAKAKAAVMKKPAVKDDIEPSADATNHGKKRPNVTTGYQRIMEMSKEFQNKRNTPKDSIFLKVRLGFFLIEFS